MVRLVRGKAPFLKKGAVPLTKPHPHPPKTFARVDERRGRRG